MDRMRLVGGVVLAVVAAVAIGCGPEQVEPAPAEPPAAALGHARSAEETIASDAREITPDNAEDELDRIAREIDADIEAGD